MRNAFSIAGIFSEENCNADKLDGTIPRTDGPEVIERSKRRKLATEVTKDQEKFWRYEILTTLNHGLARQTKPLPSGIPIQITFNRAKAAKSLLQISDKTHDGKEWTFSDSVVKIDTPILRCYFVESVKADQFYAKRKMYDVQVPFLDYALRRELLMENINEFNLKLFEGKSVR